MKADIVIIGGGIMGAATAAFLAEDGRAGDIVVVEPERTYRRTTTPNAAGGVRRLFSRPENIRLSQASLAFYAEADRLLAVDGVPADIGFRREGYLFVASEAGARQLEANFRTQEAEGVQAELLEPSVLGARFPSIGRDDVALACHAPDDGWFDPQSALQAFCRKAQSLGVTYLEDRVVGFETRNAAVVSARLESGRSLAGTAFVNTAGPWAAEIARMLDVDLPVEPLCRVQHYWLCGVDIETLPLVKDESGLFLRPEGNGFVGGRPSWEVPPGFVWDYDLGFFADYFEETVWPLLATRLPAFEAIKLQSTWGGHYAQNRFDGNMIIGRFAPGLDNILTACGFSGHGLMHAPAVGRALSELLLDGRFVTLDLTRLGFQRVLDQAPYPELGIL